MKTSIKLGIFLGLLSTIAYASPVRAELIHAGGRKGTCYSEEHTWLNTPTWDCSFPSESGVSYTGLDGLLIRGGSGADIYFCDAVSRSQPEPWAIDRCYKETIHLNGYAINRHGMDTPTDIYIFVHNGNWYTEFELSDERPGS